MTELFNKEDGKRRLKTLLHLRDFGTPGEQEAAKTRIKRVMERYDITEELEVLCQFIREYFANNSQI